jgi:anti-sigma regulatory factor (Ser/Thr protein kinase)
VTRRFLLDAVMAGTYRSRTGLGMGLCGIKRLADRMDVQTGARGSVITAEVKTWQEVARLVTAN